MLYIDGISLSKIKEELKKSLEGKRINRIFKNNEYTISIHFGKIELLLSCIPSLPICYITKSKEQPILDIASSIISNLRKNLMNAMLTDIEQLGFDRILVFHFSRINELGEIKKYKIYFECIGKLSNVIFTDEENKVLDTLKKFHISENFDRTLFLGETYTRPRFDKKILPVDVNEKDFNKILENNSLLSSKIEGVGKFLNNIKSFDEFKNILNSDIKAKIYFKDTKIKLATVLDFNFKDYDEVKEFFSYDEMINFYIDYEHTTTSFMLLKNRLESLLEKKLKKLNKTLFLIKKDIEDSKTMDKIKEEGDILASVLYSVKRGMNSIKAYDFYNNKEIEIELNPIISPNENLDRIYKKYNKVKRGLTNAIRREKEVKEEITYVESTLLFIENSQDVISLREIEEELIKLNYIKSLHNKKKTKLKKEVKYGMIEGEDYLILYGRNNLENDNLTFKVSEKDDYWFHVKDIPSSHIILKTSKLTDELIVKSAQVSAYFSKANLGEKVTVDYTLRKNVSKPNGAKPGFVIYVSQKSVTVEKIELESI
ncbi:NFACT family protein [Fusobacterium polymorphum]|uniref:Rqc2 family fibronectin-binding protein n=1 Tax=Fusobacterium nucleatum subsp. polymorphum TaxID=76857 RepID=UPI00300A7A4C